MYIEVKHISNFERFQMLALCNKQARYKLQHEFALHHQLCSQKFLFKKKCFLKNENTFEAKETFCTHLDGISEDKCILII